jgi:hypothetical protein
MTENLPATPSNVPPGWYPHATGELRWWNGEHWTEQTHVPTRTEQAKRSSKAAFWSMLLGIPALLGVPLAVIFVGFLLMPLALVGLPLAIVAFGDIRRGAAVGLGMAWAGLILNGVVWAFWLAGLIATVIS